MPPRVRNPRRSGYYLISWVARTHRIHPQTLRLYERAGLLAPERSGGRARLYSDGDLARLEVILGLTRGLGVNLAGVDVILRLREKVADLQREVVRLRKGAAAARRSRRAS
jgi:MerR family transcriptional regulator/heat shock protein HspR